MILCSNHANVTALLQTSPAPHTCTPASSTSLLSIRVKMSLRIIKRMTKLYYKTFFFYPRAFSLSFTEKTLWHSYVVTLNLVTSSFYIFPHAHTQFKMLPVFISTEYFFNSWWAQNFIKLFGEINFHDASEIKLSSKCTCQDNYFHLQ